jgi:insulysin
MAYIAAREIWIKCFNNQMRSTNYLASMAKCSFSLSSTYRNLQILGNCYSQSVGPYFEMLAKSLENFQSFDDERKFTDTRAKMVKDYKNKLVNAPFRKAFGMVPQILVNGKFTWEDYIEAFEKVSWEDFKAFMGKFLSNVRFEWLVEGNVSKEYTLDVTAQFESKFEAIYNSTSLGRDDLTKLEVIKLETGKTFFIEKEISVAEENNSCYVQVYQVGQGFEKYGHCNWLAAWLKDEYFEELRTNQQLGYAVFALTRNWNSVRHFAFCIQSDKESTNHCKIQTHKFLEEWKTKLSEMSEEQFEKIKNGCIARVTEKYKNLNEKFASNLNEVFTHDYKWNRKQLQEESINALTKAQIVEFYDQVFYSEAKTIEFHQYAPSRREEGVNFRKERVENEGVIFVESNNALKAQLEKFEDIHAQIPVSN